MNKHTKLQCIARQAADVLLTKLTDAEEPIKQAIIDLEAANQEAKDDKKPKPFSIGFSIKLDWSGGKAVYALGFSTRYKSESQEELPNPEQLGLFDGGEDGDESENSEFNAANFGKGGE